MNSKQLHDMMFGYTVGIKLKCNEEDLSFPIQIGAKFPEYWVLTESRIPLKSVLGGVRIVALSIGSHEQTQ